MSFINNLTSSFINPATIAQLAMGPAGWAAIAGRAIFSAIGQEAIQALGDKLGLPQSVIDGAQAAFCSASGDSRGAQMNIREASQSLARDFGLSPMQRGQLERGAQASLNDLIDQLSTNLAQSRESKDARGSGGKSWLMAIAESLGRTADKLAGEMKTMSDGLGKGDEKSNASDNLKFAAKSQEFSMFFGSANTVIKTLGEALASGSRKQ